MGGGEGGVELERVTVGGLGEGWFTEGKQDVAAVSPGEGRVLLGGERGLGHRERGLGLAGLTGEEAEAEQGGVVLWVGEEGFAVGLGGLEEVVLGVLEAGCFEGGWDRGEEGGGHAGLRVGRQTED